MASKRRGGGSSFVAGPAGFAIVTDEEASAAITAVVPWMKSVRELNECMARK